MAAATRVVGGDFCTYGSYANRKIPNDIDRSPKKKARLGLVSLVINLCIVWPLKIMMQLVKAMFRMFGIRL
ncbi:hypothetical protein ACFYYB_09085 [Streptomyces sp. NPDC002886]|uniref:hypothetical protein n=1 Tax=Streptomyces sp. NPDC002886 TaxID=3364667 RepID=UPI0036C1789C